MAEGALRTSHPRTGLRWVTGGWLGGQYLSHMRSLVDVRTSFLRCQAPKEEANDPPGCAVHVSVSDTSELLDPPQPVPSLPTRPGPMAPVSVTCTPAS